MSILTMPIVQLALAQLDQKEEWIQFKDAKLTFWLPKGWAKHEIREYDILQLLSPDQVIALMFVIMETNNAELILNELERTIASTIQDIRFEIEPKVIYINDLPTLTTKGTALSNGVPVKFRIWLVQNQHKSLLAFSIRNEKDTTKYEQEVENITSSIQTFKDEE
ncbi:MAG: hypothetical protein MK212_14310 [Saprospiraceae bacterium]|nr:hypothetical protein [Saprospiraceae bacterium]